MTTSATPRKYVRRDWSTIFAAWRASGVSQTAFCSREDIPPATFSAALARSQSVGKRNSHAGFARVKVSSLMPCDVELELGGGMRVCIRNIDPVDLILRLSSSVRA